MADNLALILNISIPLSCVFIMFCFVSFLCFKSYKELKEIQDDDLDGKPFELIQAAMILPIKKAPDLLTANGKNLWKNALEKLKQEQIKNNPLNQPSTFLSRGSVNNLVDEVRSNGNGHMHKPTGIHHSESETGSFADIVNSLMSKRRDTCVAGTLGLPILSNPNIPKISINPSPDDNDDDCNVKEEIRCSDENGRVTSCENHENQGDALDRDSNSSIESSSSPSSSVNSLVIGNHLPMNKQDNVDGIQAKVSNNNSLPCFYCCC